MNQKKLINNFNKAVDVMTQAFVKKYFDKDADYYWISEERSGTLSVNDYFFGLENIIFSLQYGATEKQLFEWYDMALEYSKKNKPMPCNYKNFIKYGLPNK